MNFFKNLFRKKTPEEIDRDRRIRLYKINLKHREEELKKCEEKYLRTNPKIIVLKREYKQDWLGCLFGCLNACIRDNDYERFERTLRHAVKVGFSLNDPIIRHFGLQQGRITLLYNLIENGCYYSKKSTEESYQYYLKHLEEYKKKHLDKLVKEMETDPRYSLPDMHEEWPFKTDPRYLNLLIELGANLNKIYDRDLWKRWVTAVDRATAYGYPEWFIQTLRDHGGRSWREITQGMPPEMIDEFFQRLAEENRRASRRMP